MVRVPLIVAAPVTEFVKADVSVVPTPTSSCRIAMVVRRGMPAVAVNVTVICAPAGMVVPAGNVQVTTSLWTSQVAGASTAVTPDNGAPLTVTAPVARYVSGSALSRRHGGRHPGQGVDQGGQARRRTAGIGDMTV